MMLLCVKGAVGLVKGLVKLDCDGQQAVSLVSRVRGIKGLILPGKVSSQPPGAAPARRRGEAGGTQMSRCPSGCQVQFLAAI